MTVLYLYLVVWGVTDGAFSVWASNCTYSGDLCHFSPILAQLPPPATMAIVEQHYNRAIVKTCFWDIWWQESPPFNTYCWVIVYDYNWLYCLLFSFVQTCYDPPPLSLPPLSNLQLSSLLRHVLVLCHLHWAEEERSLQVESQWGPSPLTQTSNYCLLSKRAFSIFGGTNCNFGL